MRVIKELLNRKICILSFFLFTSFILFANEESCVLHTPTGDIYGTLLIPNASQATPVALIIAGSGPTDRNGNQPNLQNNSLKYLAEGLEQNGIASLRFDKRGIGESQVSGIKEEDLRFENYIKDVEAWIDLLDSDKRFSSLVVVGHSEGSLTGMIAAKSRKADAFVSLSGLAMPADEVIKEQVEAQSQEVKEQVFSILEQLKQRQTVSDVPPMLFSLFRPSVQPYLISWMQYDPRIEIQKLSIPVLIIQGDYDLQVAAHHADLLSQAHSGATIRRIEFMNHILKKCDSKDPLKQMISYTQPDLALAEELIPEIVVFMKKNSLL
jgi:pimeloyl-ACP methyl ester carboxylesterase